CGHVLIGYCAIVALAASLQWARLEWWLDLWMPLVDILRRIIPVFDNFERALVSAGFGDRVAVIQHLLAFGWTIGVAIFAFLFFTVVSLSQAEWKRLARSVSRDRLLLLFIVSLFFFLISLYWALVGFGFTPAFALYAWHRYNVPLVGLGLFFCGLVLS